MIVNMLSMVLFLVFLVLGSFHFYWFFGGKWGLEKVIPSKKNQPSTLSIPKFATLLVGLVLVSFGLLYLRKTQLLNVELPEGIVNYGYWIIPALFIVRAIGEFKYVGFFKKVKDTEFAKADSRYFSPLCSGIGFIGLVIQLLNYGAF